MHSVLARASPAASEGQKEEKAAAPMAQPSPWEPGDPLDPLVGLCPFHLISAKSCRSPCSWADGPIRKLDNVMGKSCSPMRSSACSTFRVLLMFSSNNKPCWSLNTAISIPLQRERTLQQNILPQTFPCMALSSFSLSYSSREANSNPCFELKWSDWWRLRKNSCLYKSLLTSCLKTYPW